MALVPIEVRHTISTKQSFYTPYKSRSYMCGCVEWNVNGNFKREAMDLNNKSGKKNYNKITKKCEWNNLSFTKPQTWDLLIDFGIIRLLFKRFSVRVGIYLVY